MCDRTIQQREELGPCGVLKHDHGSLNYLVTGVVFGSVHNVCRGLGGRLGRRTGVGGGPDRPRRDRRWRTDFGPRLAAGVTAALLDAGCAPCCVLRHWWPP